MRDPIAIIGVTLILAAAALHAGGCIERGAVQVTIDFAGADVSAIEMQQGGQ